MTTPRTASPFALALAAALGVCGCALTSKADMLQSRYFAVDPPVRAANAASAPARPPGAGAPLRLGHIESGAHLREKWVYREGGGEVGFYEELRWTERPEAYLRRALLYALFEEGGLKQVVGAQAPVLDVELLAFEEVRGAQPGARVTVAVALHDDHAVQWQDTIVIEKALPPARGPARANAVVTALTENLRAAVREIAARVTTELAKLPPEASAR